MKKNWFLRIGLVALVLTLATACLLGGTFAKYTTTVAGKDSIQVAKFNFVAKDKDGVALADANKAIDLFDDVAYAAANSVATGKFAPGAYGTFQIVLDNSGSDVDVVINAASAVTVALSAEEEDVFDTSTAFIKYQISFSPIDTPEYGTVASLSDFAAALEAAIELNGASPAYIEKGTIVTIYVAYIWAGATDAVDTAIGNFAAGQTDPDLSITMSISIVADQKMA